MASCREQRGIARTGRHGEDEGSCAGVLSAAVASSVVQVYSQSLLHTCSYRSGPGLPPTLMCQGTTQRPLTRACSPPGRKMVAAATVATKSASIWEVQQLVTTVLRAEPWAGSKVMPEFSCCSCP